MRIATEHVLEGFRSRAEMRPWRRDAAFFTLILVNAALFIRPTELFPQFQQLPIYAILTLICLILAAPALLQRMGGRELCDSPITLCVLGLAPAAVLSVLFAAGGGDSITTIARQVAVILVYFLLLTAVVDSPRRLHLLLMWIMAFICVSAALAILDYHRVIDVAALSPVEDRMIDPASGQEMALPRLRGPGIFNDPNDFCQVLDAAVLIGLYSALLRKRWIKKILWLAPLPILGYAILLTQSRGGLLALVLGLAAFSILRWGWLKSLLAAALGMPALLAVAAARQTDFSTQTDTGQTRIQLWSDALEAFRSSPIFGIGKDAFVQHSGLVVHNSFLHCFAELGFLGGAVFLGAFVLAVVQLRTIVADQRERGDSEMELQATCLFAVAVAFIVGLMSLSRCYDVPTYVILGLAAAMRRFADPARPTAAFYFSARLVGLIAAAGAVFLLTMHLFVRLAVHW